MSQPPEDFEVQVAVDEEDEGLGSSIESASGSLRASVMDYRRENGRTYHRYKEGKYRFPNDEAELERLDLVHQLCLLMLDGRLGTAPPCHVNAKVGRVLDVGTGTGIWATDFGDEHPEASVLGIDLSASQPVMIPGNVRFEISDVEDDWTYSQPFEYIHSRFMTSSLTDWPLFLRRCYENLEPGGYLELQETDIFARSDDGTLRPRHALSRWSNLLMEASLSLGAPWVNAPELKNLMIESGFENVTLSMYKWPTNMWPRDIKFKELGAWNHENFRLGLDAITMAPLTRGLNWTPEEVRDLLIDVRSEGEDPTIHAYWPHWTQAPKRLQLDRGFGLNGSGPLRFVTSMDSGDNCVRLSWKLMALDIKSQGRV